MTQTAVWADFMRVLRDRADERWKDQPDTLGQIDELRFCARVSPDPVGRDAAFFFLMLDVQVRTAGQRRGVHNFPATRTAWTAKASRRRKTLSAGSICWIPLPLRLKNAQIFNRDAIEMIARSVAGTGTLIS